MTETLQTFILKGLVEGENRLGQPTFSWNGSNYVFIPSVSQYNNLLEDGGFRIVKLLSATVRKYNVDDYNNLSAIFPNGTPQAQNIITYNVDGTNYRIEVIKNDPTNSYFTMTCNETNKAT